MRKVDLALIIFILFMGCKKPTIHQKISESINFEWGLFNLKYIDVKKNELIDLKETESINSLGFEEYNHMWFLKRENREYKFIVADYHIFLNNDTLKLKISNSEDKRLNATYDMYIDTLYEEKKYHHIRLTLDSENVFIVAEKMKSKPVDYYK